MIVLCCAVFMLPGTAIQFSHTMCTILIGYEKPLKLNSSSTKMDGHKLFIWQIGQTN